MDAGEEAMIPTKPTLSIVLPAFNSAAFIEKSVNSALEFLDTNMISGEVIVVDDGSTDNTCDRVPRDERVSCIRLPRNSGKGAALRAGFGKAQGEIRAFTDADIPYGFTILKHAMLIIVERGFHAVVGDRTLPGSTYAHAGRARKIISDVASFFFRTLITGGIYDTQCGMKVFRGDVAEELFALSRVNGFAIDVELIYLLLKYRLEIKRVPVSLDESHGKSSVRLLHDSWRAAREVISLKWNWITGKYRSPALVSILQQEYQTMFANTGRPED